jgi:hypothetical protein
MKSKSTYLLVACCLFGGTRLFADTNYHKKLRFKDSAVTLRLMAADDASLFMTVQWKTEDPVSRTNNTYSATLTFTDDKGNPVSGPADNKSIYSMVTLGFQGSTTKTKITKITPGNGGTVEFCMNSTPAGQPAPSFRSLTAGQEITPAGKVKDSTTNHWEFVEDGIWLMRLKGASTFYFEVERVDAPDTVGHTTWEHGTSTKDAHDNNPPVDPPA